MQKLFNIGSFFLLLTLTISIIESIPIETENLKEDCGGLSTVLFTFVNDCKGEDGNCEVPIGSDHEIGITFVTTDIVSTASLIEVWFYYPFGSVSKIVGEEIPESTILNPETEYSFFVKAPIPDRHLGRSGELSVVLYGSELERIACGEVPVIITNSTLLKY